MLDEITYFDESDGARIAATVRAYESGQFGRRIGSQTPLPDRNYTRLSFRNDSGATVPGWGVMRITGIATVDDQPLFTISKPNTTFYRIYLVNGYDDVENGKTGWATFLWHADYILYDTASTPAYGESWGPQDGTWTIKKGNYGFTIKGANTGSGATSRTIAVQHFINDVFRGTADSDIAQDATGTISRYKSGTTTDSGINDSVIIELGSVSSGDKVYYVRDGDNFYAVAAECSGGGGGGAAGAGYGGTSTTSQTI